ncbi:MAG: His/Gly/Thr/Pro-type tRNA ligase C-terminal domain-containing protein [Parachlamydiaceae bacterium]|nr:His/Gly/Thr/Pro-type tRNA ligase C-terminal domain-containing protein [Parachlamydiaceae bacterium]
MTLPYHFSKETTERNLLASQLLAAVVLQQFPNALLFGGGLHSLGFHYDFVFEQPITSSLLEFIEVQLKTLIKEDLEINFHTMMRENAQSYFEHHHQPILGIRAGQDLCNVVDLIKIKKFQGLCSELSLKTTTEVGYIKLLGMETFIEVIDREEFKVTRIIGVSKDESKSLKTFLKAYESLLKKKDHRKLGPQLKLFSDSSKEDQNQGVTWFPKGIQLRLLFQEWISREGFTKNSIMSPWVSERLKYSLTDQHMNIYKKGQFLSELPWTVTEMSLISQECQSAEKWGLFCASSWLTEQTTMICLEHQLFSEVISSLHFIERISTILGFEGYWIWVIPRKKSSKKIECEVLRKINRAIQAESLTFPFSDLEEKQESLEDFQLEFRVRDVVNREWTLSTLNFRALASDSMLNTSESEEKSLFVLARSMIESWDRWIALLVEQYEGHFPLWLAPEQVRIIVIGESNREYALQVKEKMDRKGLRGEIDFRTKPLGERIHEAKEEKIPYLILIGENERKKQGISLCLASGKERSQFIELEPFIDKIYKESLSPSIHGDKT